MKNVLVAINITAITCFLFLRPKSSAEWEARRSVQFAQEYVNGDHKIMPDTNHLKWLPGKLQEAVSATSAAYSFLESPRWMLLVPPDPDQMLLLRQDLREKVSAEMANPRPKEEPGLSK